MDPRFGASRDGYEKLDLPRPLQSGLEVAAVGLLPLLLGLTALIRPLSGFVFAGIFLGAGALQSALAYHELLGIRRRADDELRFERWPYPLSSFAQWRASELTSASHRTALARAVARTERNLSPAFLPGASPLNRVAARPHVDLFRLLAERLAALERPVSPQAVLQVEDLLSSPESPLYARGRAHQLRSSLLACLRAVNGSPDGFAPQRVPASSRQVIPASTNGGRRLAVKTNGLGTARLGAGRSLLRRLAIARRRSHR